MLLAWDCLQMEICKGRSMWLASWPGSEIPPPGSFSEDLFSSLWYCVGKYSTIRRRVLTGTCNPLILKPNPWFCVLSASLFCHDVRNLRFTLPLLCLPNHATLKFFWNHEAHYLSSCKTFLHPVVPLGWVLSAHWILTAVYEVTTLKLNMHYNYLASGLGFLLASSPFYN